LIIINYHELLITIKLQLKHLKKGFMMNGVNLDSWIFNCD